MSPPRPATPARSRGRSSAAARLAFLLCLSLAAGCDDEPELPEDPELAVPDHEVTPAPMGAAGQMGGAGMPTSMATPTEFDPPLAVPDHEITPPPMPAMPPGGFPPGTPPGQMPPSVPGQPAVSPPVTIAAGFLPDPAVRQGVAGGPTAAASMTNGMCRGYINAGQPNHVVTLTSDFRQLRVVVSSQADTTLVIRDPVGGFHCDDDTEGLNPVVERAFGPGAYTIWVGSYAANQVGPYAIGFSERPGFSPTQLAQVAAGGEPAAP